MTARGATPLQVVARARVHDPLSSVRAARDATESGRAGTQAGWFLEAVRKYPGQTASELAQLSGGQYDRYQANRRLADLERMEQVQKGASRVSDVTEHLEVTWYPYGAEPRQLDLL